MAESRGGRQWLKYGCGGCLAFVLLGAVATVVMLGIVYVGGRPGTLEERVLTPEVPPAPAPDAEPAAGEEAPPPAVAAERPAGPGRA